MSTQRHSIPSPIGTPVKKYESEEHFVWPRIGKSYQATNLPEAKPYQGLSLKRYKIRQKIRAYHRNIEKKKLQILQGKFFYPCINPVP